MCFYFEYQIENFTLSRDSVKNGIKIVVTYFYTSTPVPTLMARDRENNTVRLQAGDLRLLALYKIEYDLPTYSAAVRHAIQRATTGDTT